MKISSFWAFFSHVLFLSLMGCGTLSAHVKDRDDADSYCSQKNSDLKMQVIEARSCSIDSDCSGDLRILSCHFTPCYGYPVNKNVDIRELEDKLVEYESSCVEPLMCACPPKDEAPKCVSGLCGY